MSTVNVRSSGLFRTIGPGEGSADGLHRRLGVGPMTGALMAKAAEHDAVLHAIGLGRESWPMLLASLLLLMVVWMPRSVVLRVMTTKKGRADVQVKQWKRLSFLLAFLLTVVLFIPLWINGLSSLGTVLGLATAALAVTMAHPLQSMLGGMYLMIRRPYQIGNRIRLGEHVGDVVDIRLLSTMLLELEKVEHSFQRTGRLIHVQNRHVFDGPIVNSSQTSGMLWDEVSTTYTFESDWQLGADLLERVVRGALPIPGQDVKTLLRRAELDLDIVLGDMEPQVYVDIGGSGVKVAVRYLVPIEQIRSVKNDICRHLLREVDLASRLEFAYPTSRSVLNIEQHERSRSPVVRTPRSNRGVEPVRPVPYRHPLDHMSVMLGLEEREGA